MPSLSARTNEFPNLSVSKLNSAQATIKRDPADGSWEMVDTLKKQVAENTLLLVFVSSQIVTLGNRIGEFENPEKRRLTLR